MSERGSFITEYIYCKNCFENISTVLIKNNKHLKGIIIPSWEINRFLPIIAGKIGGLYPGGELVDFTEMIKPKLEKIICHTIRIAILAETGEEIFYLKPKNTYD